MSDYSSDEEVISAVPSNSTASVYLTPSASGIDVESEVEKEKISDETDLPNTQVNSGLMSSTYELISTNSAQDKEVEVVYEDNTDKTPNPDSPTESHINEDDHSNIVQNEDNREDAKTTENSDDSVDSDELPELIEIVEKHDKADESDKKVEEPKVDTPEPIPVDPPVDDGISPSFQHEESEPEPSEPSVQTEAKADTIPQNNWEDLLGSGRLFVSKITEGDGKKVLRDCTVKLEILVPEVSFSTSFGTAECATVTHSIIDVMPGDQIDPSPGALEISISGLSVGSRIAVRAHKDLRADLPDEFEIKILDVEKEELKQAEDSKKKGNSCFKEKNFEKAIRYYERGIGYINEYQSENEVCEESKDLWIKLTKNLGRSLFQTQRYGKSIEKFNDILVLEPNYEVFILKADALTKDKLYDELFSTYNQMLTLDLDERKIDIVKNRQKKVSQLLKAREEKEKRTYRRMFPDSAGDSKPIKKIDGAKTQNAPAVSSGNSEESTWKYVGGAVGALVLAYVAYMALKK